MARGIYTIILTENINLHNKRMLKHAIKKEKGK